jgi:hypothetical protein
MAIFVPKKILYKFSAVVFFFCFLVMETMDLEPDSDPSQVLLEMLEPDPDSLKPVPQHCSFFLSYKTTLIVEN